MVILTDSQNNSFHFPVLGFMQCKMLMLCIFSNESGTCFGGVTTTLVLSKQVHANVVVGYALFHH